MCAAELLTDGCLTIPDAMEFSTFGRSKLYTLRDAGEVPYIRRGGRRMIPRRGLVDYLAAGLVAPQGRSSRECEPAPAGA